MPRSLDATTTLPGGLHVRLRLPHAADREALHALHARIGLAADGLELARFLRFDPCTRVVVCATAWLDGGSQVVGYGAIAHGAPEPDLLVVDEALAPGLRAVLRDVLCGGTARRRAA